MLLSVCCGFRNLDRTIIKLSLPMDVRGLMDEPWAVCGDFNIHRFLSEKRDCRSRNSAMRDFSDCIEDMDLIDL